MPTSSLQCLQFSYIRPSYTLCATNASLKWELATTRMFISILLFFTSVMILLSMELVSYHVTKWNFQSKSRHQDIQSFLVAVPQTVIVLSTFYTFMVWDPRFNRPYQFPHHNCSMKVGFIIIIIVIIVIRIQEKNKAQCTTVKIHWNRLCWCSLDSENLLDVGTMKACDVH